MKLRKYHQQARVQCTSVRVCISIDFFHCLGSSSVHVGAIIGGVVGVLSVVIIISIIAIVAISLWLRYSKGMSLSVNHPHERKFLKYARQLVTIITVCTSIVQKIHYYSQVTVKVYPTKFHFMMNRITSNRTRQMLVT